MHFSPSSRSLNHVCGALALSKVHRRTLAPAEDLAAESGRLQGQADRQRGGLMRFGAPLRA